jgi:hypothetical protein
VRVVFTSVLSTQRAEAEAEYLRDAVPALAEWLLRASTAPEGWRILEHWHYWTWSGSSIESSGDEVPLGRA